MSDVINAGAVAELLGIATATFYNRRPVLERAGFPKKLPGLNGWSRPAVRRWIATNGETHRPLELEIVPEPAGPTLEGEYGQ